MDCLTCLVLLLLMRQVIDGIVTGKPNFNPVATDFLKVRSKQTTFDPTAGYAPLIRTAARIATGLKLGNIVGVCNVGELVGNSVRDIQNTIANHSTKFEKL